MLIQGEMLQFEYECHVTMQIESYISPCTKLKSKWIKDFNVKPDTLNLIEQKVGNCLEFIGTEDNILKKAPMAQALRSRIN